MMDAPPNLTYIKLILSTLLSWLLFGNTILIHCKNECSIGWKNIGYTVPNGDIKIEYGNPLDIYCVLYEEEVEKHGPNASQYLYFVMNDKRLSREMVEIINSTTVKLHVDKPAKSQERYWCIFEKQPIKKSVCLNFVYVGVPPQPVTDFNCISYNLDNLTCSWTAPENYVNTSYNLSYIIQDLKYHCPNIDEQQAPKMNCTWSLSTDPIYRQSKKDYLFSLSMENVFGIYHMPIIHFKHFAHVRPNPPENLKVLAKTWNSLNLSWTVPTTIQTFSEGLIHRIFYRSTYENEWTMRLIKTKGGKEVKYSLNNLKYAHTYYDIRVSMISAIADQNDQSLWSFNSTRAELTSSKIPDAPPETNIGSFEILTYGKNADRTVRIYWSHIPEERRNGENFSYIIALEGFENWSNSTTDAYISKELHVNKSYNFFIWARNEMGMSKEKSVIRIPRQEDCADEPTRLTKEELGGGHYRLSWQRPKPGKNPIKNYTIFWCNDERDRPPCNGKLEWQVIPGDLASFNHSIPSNRTYQFAISANTDRGSSGMTWPHCTDMYHKYNVGRILEFWPVSSATKKKSVQVQWNFGCSDKSVTGFIIHYCPILSPEQSSVCNGSKKNLTVPKTNENTATIDNLAPYTTYRFLIQAIINQTTYSQPKELLQTTLEAAPSIPTNLVVNDVTNSTIQITWTPPNETNGKLKYYYISYNNINITTDPIDPHFHTFTLTGLASYEKYNITVQACTTECSLPSEQLQVQTKIGYPSAIRKPFMTQNDSHTLISWDKPVYPNGRNELFQVMIKQKIDYVNETEIKNVTDREYTIDRCGKENKYTSFYVSVRAMNIDGDQVFNGNWSDEVESYCRSSSNYIIYVLIPAIILFILAMTYLFKKIYNHFEAMRDVGVKLPQGLQVQESDIHLSTDWTGKPCADDVTHPAADDEEHLLMKKSEGSPNLNIDSSGCSSARDESITSSVDTCSNISSSTSDSGTEQPRTPSTEDLTETAGTSLRQRNIRPSKPYVTLPLDPSHSGSKVAPKSYCVLGVDPSIGTETSSAYIPLPLMGDKPVHNPPENTLYPPYVLTGELLKTPNPSYIPFKAPNVDLSTKNPAYVIAGTKDLSPDILQIDTKQPIASPDSAYIKVAENASLKSPETGNWQPQPPSSTVNSKTGYVSIGEVPSTKKESKGYVPHRHFESKALKED